MGRKSFIGLLLFSLLGCSNEVTITKVTEAQSKADFDNSPPSIERRVESPLKVVGDFSNIKGDGEHEWGYSVALWRQEDKLYGLISGSDALRLSGDSPLGLLENVQFDPKTGKLSFQSKLSLGMISDKEWSRDIYEFEGVLTKTKLKGNLLITNELCANKCPERKKITLRLSEDMTQTMYEFKTYEEWKVIVDKALKRLGPKW